MEPQLLTVIDKEKLKSWTPEEWDRWWIEPKRDGFRAIFRNGKFYSRTGKPLYNLEHIEAELKWVNWWMLDGEIHGATWAETSSVARASKTKKESNLRYYVFDGMDDESWTTQKNADPLDYRRCDLRHLFSRANLKYVTVANHWRVKSYTEFLTIHNINLDNGCDGTVLKLADSLYEFKRTKTWLKVKPEETFDGVCLNLKEGEKKYEGTLGALGVWFNGKLTWVSGMTDEQRDLWWNNWQKKNEHDLFEKVIEVKARGVHPSGALIEPRFVRVREDKNI